MPVVKQNKSLKQMKIKIVNNYNWVLRGKYYKINQSRQGRFIYSVSKLTIHFPQAL